MIKKLLFALLLLAMVYLPAFIFISFLTMNSHQFATKVQATPWLPVPIVAGITLVMALILISIFSRFNFSDYGFKLSRDLMILKALICGVVIGGVLSFAGSFVPSRELSFGSLTFLQRLLVFWILASVTEEIIFRGLIQTYLSWHISGSVTIFRSQLTTAGLITATFFGLVHLALLSQSAATLQAITIVLVALILGIIAGYFRDKTGSLVAPIIVHSLFNITGSIVGSAI
jgi:membrane protease YdiL (CAAX protease family)